MAVLRVLKNVPQRAAVFRDHCRVGEDEQFEVGRSMETTSLRVIKSSVENLSPLFSILYRHLYG